MKDSIQFHIKTFQELTTLELYEILKLRTEVFVVEQNCPYLEVDGKDQQAIHIYAEIGEEIIGYSRCFAPGLYFDEAAIGRVLIKENYRSKGVAHQLMQISIQTLKEKYPQMAIKISAQQYLINFYENHGFKTIGEEYLEDDIPHIAMLHA